MSVKVAQVRVCLRVVIWQTHQPAERHVNGVVRCIECTSSSFTGDSAIAMGPVSSSDIVFLSKSGISLNSA